MAVLGLLLTICRNNPRIEITAPENGFNHLDSPAAQLHKEELKKEL